MRLCDVKYGKAGHVPFREPDLVLVTAGEERARRALESGSV